MPEQPKVIEVDVDGQAVTCPFRDDRENIGWGCGRNVSIRCPSRAPTASGHEAPGGCPLRAGPVLVKAKPEPTLHLDCRKCGPNPCTCNHQWGAE